ncbi:MAG: hypothetical protein CMP49_05650 [Flavobacteriales bacterium]|nr:hypothetical protein [Flavobacteriales bacterium]
MLVNYHLFYCQIIMFIIVNFGHSQSFDIYDERIQLKNYNYNFKQNKYSTSFNEYPKSVKLENAVNELLDPVIKLNSSEQLILSFDILEAESTSYAYTFIHCTANWEYSEINQFEYLNGFFNNYINEYQYSFNTLTPYVNYYLSFPNENISFKKSGNYILLVYDTENNLPIITKRFMVYEEILSISLNVKKATLAKDQSTKQEIDFNIEGHKKLNIIDPHNELYITIQKNDDWNNIINNVKPSFVSDYILEYDYQGEISFSGGNEYKDFDIKSLRYFGKNIQNIKQQVIQGLNIYVVNLQIDYIENTNEYKFQYDLNGKYVISLSERRNKNTEGDYALVKFILHSNKIENKDLYIHGELTNWDILKEAKMQYNDNENYYYGSLFLKQGYYNYNYVSTNLNGEDIEHIEGEYHETRNQYSIYTYYTPVWRNYDRLVGIAKSTSNSLN